jgi:hypothetical protein
MTEKSKGDKVHLASLVGCEQMCPLPENPS